MKKKIAAIRSKSGKIVSRFKRTKKVVYQPNPTSHIPHTISMPGVSFYEKFEHHLQNSQTVIPVIDDKLTWKLLVKHNPKLNQLRGEIILREGRNYPDKAWDNVAHRLVKVLQKNHLPVNKKS